ncbi:hypothetical protein A2U01_0098885, partial [Trifolium medium]|nr:hypothetical protein [Trifolium medium]
LTFNANLVIVSTMVFIVVRWRVDLSLLRRWLSCCDGVHRG